MANRHMSCNDVVMCGLLEDASNQVCSIVFYFALRNAWPL